MYISRDQSMKFCLVNDGNNELVKVVPSFIGRIIVGLPLLIKDRNSRNDTKCFKLSVNSKSNKDKDIKRMKWWPGAHIPSSV